MNLIGTTVRGIRLPIISQGDDVKNIICDYLKDTALNEQIIDEKSQRNEC